jgi:hypothetical protein
MRPEYHAVTFELSSIPSILRPSEPAIGENRSRRSRPFRFRGASPPVGIAVLSQLAGFLLFLPRSFDENRIDRHAKPITPFTKSVGYLRP